MNESTDRVLADWLREGPDSGPREALERALTATRRTGQRSVWTMPGRWFPTESTMAGAPAQRPLLALLLLVALVMTLVVASLLIGSRSPDPPSPFRNGAVVFGQDGDLFIADQLGGTPRPLVAGPEVDSEPLFNDQGDRVAFVRDLPGGNRIMAVRPDGSELTELATLSGPLDRLVWSPDGRALLAIRGFDREPTWYQTDIIASDGSGAHRLDPGGHVIWAMWRPGSQQILFNGVLDGDDHQGDQAQHVYIVDADGSALRELPIPPFLGLLPAWSPDGRRIAFVSGDPESVLRINIADVDRTGALTGSRELRFDPESSNEYEPQWSPDGSRLAIRLSKDGEYVGVVDPDGSDFRIIVPEGSALGDDDFMWSPDGRSLLFVERIEDDLGNAAAWGTVWSLDVATGQQTEVQTPAETWQRLPP